MSSKKVSVADAGSGSTSDEASALNDKRKFGDRGSTGSEPDTPLFKKVLLEPADLDLNDIHDTSDSHGTTPKHTVIDFSDMLIKTFQQESFLNVFVPILATVMTPIIQASVDAAIGGLRDSVVIPLQDKNKELRESVDKQNKVINEQKIQIDDNKQINEKLVDEVQMLFLENEDLQLKLNDQEQYGRRNSLRINNFKMHPSVRTEDEMSEIIIDFINGQVLNSADSADLGENASPDSVSGFKPSPKLDPISLNDIERCHFVGRSKKQIIVKFSRYHDKRRVYMNKKNLKNNPRKIFITEDLTKMNHNLVKILSEEQYEKKTIFAFWTSDGNIFVKRRKDDAPVRVRTRGDIIKLLRKPEPSTAVPNSMDSQSY